MAQPELQERRRKAPRSPVTYEVMGEERERHRKRRKRGRKETAEGVEEEKKEQEEEQDEERFPRRDPLEVFDTGIMLKILSNLDASSVALSLLVCRGWHAVASSDRIWAAKLEQLWLGKAHIPRLSHVRGLSKLAAYSLAVMDGKRVTTPKSM